MALRWIVALLCVQACVAHVRLTWPKARYPQLDFLDNARTGLPCGVAFSTAKRVVTTVAAGSALDLQWHLGFAHRGGIIANLLTPLASYNLTAGWVKGYNPTLLTYQVTLPNGITCSASNTSDCILQLRHQALEWGANYIFHSCADLNIVATANSDSACGATTGGVCSGNGECVNNKCVCRRLTSGTFCQNVDECNDNVDCGGNNKGLCVSTASTSYPKKQCYCRAGWMGPRCGKVSELDNALIQETGYYQNKMKISDNYYLYWKLNSNSQPPTVEVAMKVRTESWVGLGWRPSGLGIAACHNNPGPLTTAANTNARRCRPAAEAEPEGTTAPAATTPAAEGEPAPESEAEAEAEPSSTLPICDANGNPPTGEPESAPEGTAAPETTAEGTAAPEATAEGTAEPEATAEGTAEPEATAEGTAEPETTGEPEGEPENGGATHAMDCRDMVIGMATGCAFRIMDAYSRDRSTPAADSFYGGEDNLKGAVGMQNNGWTYIKFMRNMDTGSKFDHPFSTSSPMNMIWAHGQRQGAYTFNVVPSGVSETNASDPAFYKNDELKYHGFTNNRGAITVDLTSVTPTTSTPTGTTQPTPVINYALPSTCSGSTCLLKVTAVQDTSRQFLDITMQWNNAQNWVALGTTADRLMPATDLSTARMVGGQIRVDDRYATAYLKPPIDTDQSQISNVVASSASGVNTVTFRRPCMVNNAQDISFPGNYLAFGFGPLASEDVGYHSGQTPSVSSDKLMITCSAATGEPEPESTTAEPESTPEGTAEPTSAQPEGEPEGSQAAPAATTGPVTEQVLTTNQCAGIDYSGSGAGQLAVSALLVAVTLALLAL